MADVLKLAKVYTEEQFKNFEEAVKVVEPIYKRLESQVTLDIYDLRILSHSICYISDAQKALELCENLVKYLENHKESDHYNIAKVEIFSNTVIRFIKLKYLEGETQYYKKQEKEIINYANMALKIAYDNNIKDYMGTTLIKRGILLKNVEEINIGLDFVKGHSNKKIYNAIFREVENYKSNMNFPISLIDFRKIVGKNLRKERKQRNLDLKTVAIALDLTVSGLGLIESGSRGLTLFNLFKLHEIFGINMDTIVYGNKENLPNMDINNITVKKIKSIASSLPPKKLEALAEISQIMQEY